MSAFQTKTATHTVTTTPAENGGVAAPKSIRQIMMGGILAQTPKAEVEAEVVRLHPNSAAAKKFGKHYAWYKGTMKKAGQLEGIEMTTEAKSPARQATIEELEAQLAQLKAAAVKALEPKAETEEERIERLQLEMLAEVERKLAELDGE